MIGLTMMVGGIVMLLGGYFVYSNNVINNEPNHVRDNGHSNGEVEMAALIKAVSADGVFTENERVHIIEVADKYKMDKRSVLVRVKEQIALNNTEPETEIIDQAKKKGDDFEKFMAKKINKKYFTIKQWAGDKYVEGIYSEKTTQPDLVIEFAHKDYTKVFAVECKYRSKVGNGKVIISYEDQLNRYRKFEKEESIDVYIAIGIGGKASNPDELYLIPLSELSFHEVAISTLLKYRKEVGARFFLNMGNGVLNISYPPES